MPTNPNQKLLKQFFDFLIINKNIAPYESFISYTLSDFKKFLKVKKLPKKQIFELIGDREQIDYNGKTFNFKYIEEKNINATPEFVRRSEVSDSAGEQFSTYFDTTTKLDKESELRLITRYQEIQQQLPPLQKKLERVISSKVEKVLKTKIEDLVNQREEILVTLFQALAKQGFKLAHQKAKQSYFYNTGLDGVDIDDLTSEIYFGFIEALNRFDISKGFRFSTTFQFWVNQRMNFRIQKSGLFIRLPANKINEVNYVKLILPQYYYLKKEQGEDVFYQTLATELTKKFRNRFSPKVAAELVRLTRSKSYSYDAPINEDNEKTMSLFVHDDKVTPDGVALKDNMLDNVFTYLQETFDNRPSQMMIFLKRNNYEPYLNPLAKSPLFKSPVWSSVFKSGMTKIQATNSTFKKSNKI